MTDTIPTIPDNVTITYIFPQISSKTINIKDDDLTLDFAIRIVDGIHSNYVGAINRTFMYDRDTHAKSLAMVLEAARMYNNDELKAVLSQCAAQFRMYEKNHRDKAANLEGTYMSVSHKLALEKADVNKRMAELCEQYCVERVKND